ncbi:hypothetical protein C0995_000045 [Termitomyces sp. Mi166|nr:hypothetical protein C0995_000045 [Termitomyces sp. Mi166\
MEIQPNIFKTRHVPFTLEVHDESVVTESLLGTFVQSTLGDVLGLAPTYGSKCALTTLAIFNGTKALLVRFTKYKAGKKTKCPLGRTLLQLLLLSQHKKVALKMDRLAAALYLDVGLYIARGIDLLSVAAAKDGRNSFSAFMSALGGEVMLHRAKVAELFMLEEKDSSDLHYVALRAWAAYQAASLEAISKLLVKSPEVNTKALDTKHLKVISKVIRDADRIIALKPTRQKNEIEKHYSHKQGKLEVRSSRFKTRLMRHNADQLLFQTIEIHTTSNKAVSAKVTKVTGRAASLDLHGHLHGEIHSVTTVGRESLTRAEEIRDQIALGVLTLSNHIMQHPFVQRIWLPSKKVSWANTPSSFLPVAINFSGRPLNLSQTQAVNAILSNKDAHRVTLIHGPPGTGKTTVIAAAITSIIFSGDPVRTVWVVAQSNVAVKNVAEKLADVGFFDFKILVSKDFHFDWHEHLYGNIDSNLIRSDDFSGDVVGTERLLLGSRVLLCTLSMLSHDKLTFFTQIVPLQTIIVDEASQIEVADYLPPLQRFKVTLRKMVFIGDNKQLAPYGRGDIPELQSIFEMSHLRQGAILLDTQYRMPTPIGNFISREVYGGRLKSIHPIEAWLSCSFIDVATGREEKYGNSWVNLREVATAISIAQMLYLLGKSFRIITPYDAQRSKLEDALKGTIVPWEDTCFNVDSFQGNEADYIILSVVRSEKIGFMRDARRTNVMLTRCKRNMIILTNRRFIEGVASSTLIGRLAKACGRCWIGTQSVVNGGFHLYT